MGSKWMTWVSQLLRIQKKSYGTINNNYADNIIGTTSIYMYNEKNIIKIDQIFHQVLGLLT